MLSLRVYTCVALDVRGSNSHINRSRESPCRTYLLIQFTRVRVLLIGNLLPIILILSGYLNFFIIFFFRLHLFRVFVNLCFVQFVYLLYNHRGTLLFN